MQPVYYAHSLKDKETHDWQLLSRHLREVANLAGDLGAPLGIGRVTTLAGLLHDLGKYNPAFQAYIAGHGSSVDHSTAGARLVGDMTDPKTVDKIAAELVAYAVAGHHVGLPDKQSSGPSSLDERLRGFVDTLDPVWRTEIAPETSDLLPKLAWVKGDTDKAAFQLALLGRMIFSCLVDADFRNTEQFYAEAEGRDVDRQWPALINVLPRLLARFDAHMDGMPASDESINRLRRHILIHVRGKANLTPGLLTLTVPTGGGKTLASLGFALDHARRYGHSRIIYAIPFTSIVEQIAGIFRQVLGDVVLEHHSAIDDDRRDGGDARTADSRDETIKLRRAMEDWSPPVVVTTNVQFFESLFASRTSRARKLHNIAGSIIIL